MNITDLELIIELIDDMVDKNTRRSIYQEIIDNYDFDVNDLEEIREWNLRDGLFIEMLSDVYEEDEYDDEDE